MLIRNMLSLAAAIVASCFLQSAVNADSGRNRSESDIVTTAVEAGAFNTLVAAVKAADLVDALQSPGPFTVFAPTDEAFEKLPAGTVETLLKPENKDQLIAILKYHVVAGKVDSKAVTQLRGAVTLNGQRVDIKVDQGNVMVDGAKVVKADIQCSNGIIHVIDQVILPAGDDIVTAASKAGQFKTLLAAAQAAGLAEALQGDGPFTVFAPTDEAFAKLPEGTVANLLKEENRGKLAEILKYHVVPGRVYSEDVLGGKELKTLQGQTLEARVESGRAMIENAGIVATDIDASNGVIHVIDSVMLPAEEKSHGTPSEVRVEYRRHVCPQTGRVTTQRVVIRECSGN